MKKALFKSCLVGLFLSMSSLANAGLITLNDTDGSIVDNSLIFGELAITLSGGGRDVGAPFADAGGVYNSIDDGYPTANDITFTFDRLVDNVSFSFDPFGLSTPGRGDLWIEVFNGAVSLGLQEVQVEDFHNESLASFGPMTSFVVNNGCDTVSGDTSCSWISQYSAVSYEAVPEPSTVAILALGLIGMASRRFKKSL